MKPTQSIGLLLAVQILCLTTLLAQEKPKASGVPPTSGLRAELLKQCDDAEKKLVDLAQAMPQEKYAWRPGDGVRSVSEVYMHVVGANYFLPSFAGVKPPEGLSRDMEKTVTEKAKVVEMLKESFDHVRQAIVSKSEADLDSPAKLFGQETTVRDVFLTTVTHMHEHLGQSIAYARMNGVVPPWTAAQQAPRPEAPKK
jgi:uncharacterized damage-inducible protein DinB